MARGYLTFGDIEGKLDVLCVECTKCDRKGRYSERAGQGLGVQRLLAGRPANQLQTLTSGVTEFRRLQSRLSNVAHKMRGWRLAWNLGDAQ